MSSTTRSSTVSVHVMLVAVLTTIRPHTFANIINATENKNSSQPGYRDDGPRHRLPRSVFDNKIETFPEEPSRHFLDILHLRSSPGHHHTSRGHHASLRHGVSDDDFPLTKSKFKGHHSTWLRNLNLPKHKHRPVHHQQMNAAYPFDVDQNYSDINNPNNFPSFLSPAGRYETHSSGPHDFSNPLPLGGFTSDENSSEGPALLAKNRVIPQTDDGLEFTEHNVHREIFPSGFLGDFSKSLPDNNRFKQIRSKSDVKFSESASHRHTLHKAFDNMEIANKNFRKSSSHSATHIQPKDQNAYLNPNYGTFLHIDSDQLEPYPHLVTDYDQFPPLDMNHHSAAYSNTDHAPYPPIDTDHAPYPPVDTDHAPYPSTDTNHAPYPPIDTDKAPYNPTDTDHAPYHPTDTDHAPYPPIDTNHALYPLIDTDHALYPPIDTNHALYPPVDTDHAPHNTPYPALDPGFLSQLLGDDTGVPMKDAYDDAYEPMFDTDLAGLHSDPHIPAELHGDADDMMKEFLHFLALKASGALQSCLSQTK